MVGFAPRNQWAHFAVPRQRPGSGAVRIGLIMAQSPRAGTACCLPKGGGTPYTVTRVPFGEPIMTLKSLILAFTVAFGMSLSSFASPAAAFTGGNFPACDAPQVLTHIQKRFVWTDTHLLQRGLAIEQIEEAHHNKSRVGDQYWSIPRLYCHGTARMNDGSKRTIWWLIEGGMGFAGLRDNLEFCISGLDPLKVHGAWCRSVR